MRTAEHRKGIEVYDLSSDEAGSESPVMLFAKRRKPIRYDDDNDIASTSGFGTTDNNNKSDMETSDVDVDADDSFSVEDPVPISYDFDSISVDELPTFIEGKYATGSPVTPNSAEKKKRKKKSHFGSSKSLSLSRSKELADQSKGSDSRKATSETESSPVPKLTSRKTLRYPSWDKYVSTKVQRTSVMAPGEDSSSGDEEPKLAKSTFYGSKPTQTKSSVQKKQEKQV